MNDATEFMKKRYRVVLTFDPDGYWIAENPELPGCKADGETEAEALASLEVSRELWIESRLATGQEVPEPQETQQYSGKFVLRVPKNMHRELTQEAEAENQSLNAYVNHVLAGRHSKTTKIVYQMEVPQQNKAEWGMYADPFEFGQSSQQLGRRAGHGSSLYPVVGFRSNRSRFTEAERLPELWMLPGLQTEPGA